MAVAPPSDAEDEVLVAAMAAGDRAALATLYERHSALLLGLALRIVRERREAEDLLHDVFLEAWRSAKDSIRSAAGFVPGWPSVCARVLSTSRSLPGWRATPGMAGWSYWSMTRR